jgi:hypothetical protein
MVMRKVRTAELRRMAEMANAVERQRKLLVRADRWDEGARPRGERAR